MYLKNRVLILVALKSALLPAFCFAASKNYFAAVGVAITSVTRKDYGSSTQSHWYPEVLGYGYFSIAKKWFLRPGLRLGYQFGQPQMPRSVRVEEKDLSLQADVSVLFDWFVVPSVGFGGGVISRSLSLKVADPVALENDSISADEKLGFVSGRMGIAIPLIGNRVVIEPYLGTRYVFQDTRELLYFGAETTFGF